MIPSVDEVNVVDQFRALPKVGWTCPKIDKVKRLVRRSMSEPDRSEALALMEQLRSDNTALRDRANMAEDIIASAGKS